MTEAELLEECAVVVRDLTAFQARLAAEGSSGGRLTVEEIDRILADAERLRERIRRIAAEAVRLQRELGPRDPSRPPDGG